MARLSPGWHELVRATDRLCLRPCAFACVCVRVCATACVCACARVCLRLRARVFVCAACAFAGVHVAVLLRGALRMHSWYLRDTKGTRRVLRALEGYSEGTHASVERSSTTSWGSLRLMGCTLGYLWGNPRKCVRACVAVPLLGSMTRHDGDALLCTAKHRSRRTGSTGGVLDEYSRRPMCRAIHRCACVCAGTPAPTLTPTSVVPAVAPSGACFLEHRRAPIAVTLSAPCPNAASLSSTPEYPQGTPILTHLRPARCGIIGAVQAAPPAPAHRRMEYALGTHRVLTAGLHGALSLPLCRRGESPHAPPSG
jgi:hypothetical protein